MKPFGESSSLANYFLALCVVFLYVPIALLVIFYSIIFMKLNTQIFPGEQSDNAEQQRAKRNRKLVKVAIAIVVGFVLCWVPWSIINLLVYFARGIGEVVALWNLFLPLYCIPYFFFKLCHHPLHLFYIQWKLSPGTEEILAVFKPRAVVN